MVLPEGFTFTQASLQDYVDCPRRFQLRYVLGQRWPAVEAEPLFEHELSVRRGERFHRLVERHQLGLPLAHIEMLLQADATLRDWWESYLSFSFLHNLSGLRRPELRLTADLGSARVVAALDLVVVQPGERLYIFDWKTHAPVPGSGWLRERMQTALYLWLGATVGPALFGAWVKPERISMIYWFTAAPDAPARFDYSAEQYERHCAFLSSLVAEILAGGEGIWPLTEEKRRCRHCVFRSLCARGGAAGLVDELEIESEADVALSVGALFESVDEVGF